MVWESSRGEFVSSAHQRLAEVLHDYNPVLSLAYIPAHDRSAGDTKPFAIIEDRPGFEPVIIRYLTEEQLRDPKAVLAWVFEGDLARHGGARGLLRRMELEDRAARLLTLKRREDELADQREFSCFVLTGGREHKNYYRLGKDKKVSR